MSPQDDEKSDSPGVARMNTVVTEDMRGRYLPFYVDVHFVQNNERSSAVVREVSQSEERKKFLEVLRQVAVTARSASSTSDGQASKIDKKEEQLTTAFIELANLVAQLCGAETIFQNSGARETTNRVRSFELTSGTSLTQRLVCRLLQARHMCAAAVRLDEPVLRDSHRHRRGQDRGERGRKSYVDDAARTLPGAFFRPESRSLLAGRS
jgi:hypothetical protein